MYACRGAVSLILVSERVLSNFSQAVRCVAELQASYFGHEVAYRAIVLAIDQVRYMLAYSASVLAIGSSERRYSYKLICYMQEIFF